MTKTDKEIIEDIGKIPNSLNKKYPAGGVSVWVKGEPSLRTITDDLGFWIISMPYAVLEKDYGKRAIIMMQAPGQKAIDSSKFRGADRNMVKNLLTSPYTETHDDLPAGPGDVIDGYSFTGIALKNIREDRKYLLKLIENKQERILLKDGKELLSVYLRGKINNKTGQAIEDASVWLKRNPSFLHRSNEKGEFEILSKNAVLYLYEQDSIMITAPKYKPKEIKIESYLTDKLNIQLEPLEQPKIISGKTLPMVKIPAGFFRMGKGLKKMARGLKEVGDFNRMDCWPIQTINMPSFYFAQTQLDANIVMEIFNWARKNGYNCNRLNYFVFPLLANALSERDGFTPCYMTKDGKVIRSTTDMHTEMVCLWRANGYRIPTYAEHEYACYAGRTGNYYWGNDGSQFYDYHWSQFIDTDDDDDDDDDDVFIMKSSLPQTKGQKLKKIRIKYPNGPSNTFPRGRQSALDWRIYDSANGGLNTTEPCWDLSYWRADDSYAPKGPSVSELNYISSRVLGAKGLTLARLQISIQDSHDGHEAFNWPKLDKPLAFGFYGFHAISGFYFSKLLYPMPTRLVRSAENICKDLTILKKNDDIIHKLSQPIDLNKIETKLEMVEIPNGKFLMGGIVYNFPPTSDVNNNHLTYWGNVVRDVSLDSYKIGKFEVTIEQWQLVYSWAIKNGYNDLPKGDKGDASSDNLKHPVCNVNWYDSIKWCNAASEMNSLKPCYMLNDNIYKTGENKQLICDWNANGYRLPTEAEWEYAASGGSKDSFYWGGHFLIKDYGWTKSHTNSILKRVLFYGGRNRSGSSEGTTHPVGQKIGNQYGLYDVFGNVFEWCWDIAAPYNPKEINNPKGPVNTQAAQILIKNIKGKNVKRKNIIGERALRGLAYDSNVFYKGYVGHHNRSSEKPNVRLKRFGFRVAKNND